MKGENKYTMRQQWI